MSYRDHVHSSVAHLSIEQVLRENLSGLLGVSSSAKEALHKVNIRSIFDLGMSDLFDNAARIQAASDDPASLFRKFGRVPLSLLSSSASSEEATHLPYESIAALAGIDPANASSFAQELGVSTIRDLAFWPPFLAAKAIVSEAYNPDPSPAGLSATEQLTPKAGEFATERHLYSSVVMLPGEPGSTGSTLTGRLFDITATPDVGFERLRFGALVTYSQSWFPLRVAKGHLLHSLPLAPGESTRVAVISWSNKSSAATRESLSETEKLSSTMDSARSVSEVAGAVAKEFQSGSSISASESATESAGAIALIPFLAGAAAGGAAAAETAASSHTVSSGDRRIDTHLQQNIRDSTQQVSSSLRARKAAVITEVTQRQSEHLSTRTVTNYNHMHALTIQYYEIVQICETRTQLEDCTRLIFLPLELIDFQDERNILRNLHILRAAALDDRTRGLLDELLETGGINQLRFKIRRFPELSGVGKRLIANLLRPLRRSYAELDREGFVSFKQDLEQFGINPELVLNNVGWDSPARPEMFDRVVLELEDGDTIDLKSSPKPDAPPTLVNSRFPDGAGLSLGKLRALRVFTKSNFPPPTPAAPVARAYLRLALQLNGEARWLDCSIAAQEGPAEYNDEILFEIETMPGLVELGSALMEHRLYYSQQIWRRQNPQLLIMQLAQYQLKVGTKQINLVDYLNPVPVTTVGNYAVYKFTFEDDAEWKAWVADNCKPSLIKVDQVAVPTGGVFAEAVLGRFNSAEKLDATRFFNWQDSPPDQPPNIAPLEAGLRTSLAQAPALSTSPDSALRVLERPGFPDPGGLSSSLQALVMAELFRNMSAAKETGDAAATGTGAAAQLSVEALARAGSAIAKTLTTASSALGKLGTKEGLASVSSLGALVNTVQKAAGQLPQAGSGTTNADILRSLVKGTLLEGIVEDALRGKPSAADLQTAIGRRSSPESALSLSASLKARSSPARWKLDRNAVFNRLDQLITTPDLVQQGAVNLCGPAAFVRFWLTRDPLAVAQFAGEMYELGKAKLGKLEVAPSSGSIIDKDYAQILAEWDAGRAGTHSPAMPPEADWMLMGALRAAANLGLVFGGLPSTLDASAITLPHEVAMWLSKSGLYADVRNETSLLPKPGLAHALQLQPGASRDVCLLIDAKLLAGQVAGSVSPFEAFFLNLVPNHYIDLVSPVRTEPNDKVSFEYWSWGAASPITVAKAFFEENYYGAIIAEGRAPG